MISPAVHESLARTTRERCIQEEKEAAVPFTRVPAKEAPSKTNRQSTVGAICQPSPLRPLRLDRQSPAGWPRFTADQTLR